MSGNLIDWLSISLPYNNIFQTDDNSNFVIREVPHNKRMKLLTDWLNTYGDWTLGQGRKVFDKSAFSAAAGITIFWRDTLPYSLVEITGTGCNELRIAKVLPNFVAAYGNWLTRIDISRDIECDTDPRDFAKMRDTKRFSSYDEKKEDRGVTYYVGSRSSERYACVYRYSEPHPRAGLLRVEHRLKGDYAKTAAALLLSNKISGVMKQLGVTFGWSHPSWGLSTDGEKMPGITRDTKQGKTERWLLKSVLPAIKKLLQAGGDDFIDFFLKEAYNLLNEYRDSKGRK